jgi:hypothetical protein
MTKYQRDLIERMVRTFAAAALGAAASALPGAKTSDDVRALVALAVTTGVTAVIGLFAKKVGDPDSASLID